MIVHGVPFHCYRVGTMQYEWVSDDGRCRVGASHARATFYAVVDGQMVIGRGASRRTKRFRSIKSAMAAAVGDRTKRKGAP